MRIFFEEDSICCILNPLLQRKKGKGIEDRKFFKLSIDSSIEGKYN